jgi:alpha-L-fucosidase
MSPSITRNQTGEIIITPVDAESDIYYTMDGSEPTPASKKYNGPFQTEGKVQVSAIAYEPASGKSSPVCHEEFDQPRTDWKFVGVSDRSANAILDGNPSTAWHQPRNTRLPADLVIDLGKEQNLCGFRYYPDQTTWGPGIITQYEFYVSNDHVEWKLVNQGEFFNIKNNPTWQIKKFEPVKARYIKLRALKNTENNNNLGYAEIDVITE